MKYFLILLNYQTYIIVSTKKLWQNRNILVFIGFRSEHSFRIGMLEIEQRKENDIIDTSENNVFFFLL